MMAYYIAKVLTRRDQLGMRKKKGKGKGKGDKGKKSDAEDGECDQGSQKRKKPRVAGKKKHGKTNTTKRARKVKGKDSEAEVCDTPDAPLKFLDDSMYLLLICSSGTCTLPAQVR